MIYFCVLHQNVLQMLFHFSQSQSKSAELHENQLKIFSLTYKTVYQLYLVFLLNWPILYTIFGITDFKTLNFS